MTEATVPAWFSFLAEWELPVVAAAVKRAVASSPTFVPAAPLIAEHCRSVAKTAWGGPEQNLSLPALPEPEPELDPSNPLCAKFQDINARVRSGELAGPAIARAYVSVLAS